MPVKVQIWVWFDVHIIALDFHWFRSSIAFWYIIQNVVAMIHQRAQHLRIFMFADQPKSPTNLNLQLS